MNLKIRTTNDGSTTLYHRELDENYHSVFGALQEAQHIYIQAGFQQLSPSQSEILEIGFGTALNALLTCQAATKQQKKVNYHSIENYPLPPTITKQLDFGDEHNALLHSFHSAAWNTDVAITPYFNLRKVHADLLTYQFSKKYDLIYYDAFAPDKQPELWTPKILHKIADSLLPQGILTTYSTKGTVKQAFRNANLQVKRLPGPLGKRDMLRCIKI